MTGDFKEASLITLTTTHHVPNLEEFLFNFFFASWGILSFWPDILPPPPRPPGCCCGEGKGQGRGGGGRRAVYPPSP